MNMPFIPQHSHSKHSKLLSDLSKDHDLLDGASEYAFLCGHINSEEYDYWKNLIYQASRKKTQELLARIGG